MFVTKRGKERQCVIMYRFYTNIYPFFSLLSFLPASFWIIWSIVFIPILGWGRQEQRL